MKKPRESSNPPLVLSFEVGAADHTFLVTLPNGASFVCDQRHLGGKLADNLLLYSKACQREQKTASSNPVPCEGMDYSKLVSKFLETNEVTKVGVVEKVKPERKLTLADLKINIGEVK